MQVVTVTLAVLHYKFPLDVYVIKYANKQVKQHL